MAALVASCALVACGGGDQEASEAPPEAAPSADTETEITAQPPPETPPGASTRDESVTTERGERGSAIEQDAATGAQSCPDVVITPDSGNGMFAVEAEGITCEDASAALEAWGTAGYPGGGPPGFACEEVAGGAEASARLSCEQEASGAVVEFDTGV